MSILEKEFNKKPKKKPYKNIKGNNSTRVKLSYKELEDKLKNIREEKNNA